MCLLNSNNYNKQKGERSISTSRARGSRGPIKDLRHRGLGFKNLGYPSGFERGPAATVPAPRAHLCAALMSSVHRADDSATIPMQPETSLKRPLRGLPSPLTHHCTCHTNPFAGDDESLNFGPSLPGHLRTVRAVGPKAWARPAGSKSSRAGA